MEWWGLLICAAVALAAATAAVPAETRPENGLTPLCETKDVCKCSPTVISCVCTKDVQHLVVKTGGIQATNLQTLTKFEVKDCSSLSFFEQAFKPAPVLQMVHVSNVKNVSFNSNVFETLQILMIDLVGSLVLHTQAFQGIHGLNNIVITRTHIPELDERTFNIKDLQEFKLSEVSLDKIRQNAVFINLKTLGSKAEILKSKIGSVDENGLQIGNGSSITVQDTEIQRAAPKSIRLGALETFTMKGNKFQPDVDVNAAKILYNNSIEFSKNVLFNVDLSSATKIPLMPINETIFTLEILVSLHGENYVNCKCIDPASNVSKALKQNRCNNGCTEATVAAFLQSCEKNNAISVEERLKTLCKNTADKSTTTPRTTLKPATHFTTTPSKRNSAGKKSVYVLMPLAFFLFHMIL